MIRRTSAGTLVIWLFGEFTLEAGHFVQVQRTMLELLNQLDGFEATNQIKVAGGTWNARLCEGDFGRRARFIGGDGDQSYRHPRRCAAAPRPH